ncbi:MAG: peroxidase [Chloroflexi bacterium]|nr:peroxidase [Chloroflexota bacterium]
MTMPKQRIAWIETIAEAEASGELKRTYQGAGEPGSDHVDHIMKIHSLHPQSLIDHLHLYKTLMAGAGPLSLAQREMIGVVVSSINRCEY